MRRHPEISAFILGGGASTRMGVEKGLLRFGDEPLIARTAKLLEPLVCEVVVVGRPETYSGLGLQVIPDRLVTTGIESATIRTPLMGIATALCITRSPWNLILACDLPYLTPEWVDWLLVRALESRFQVVMPCTANGLQPLAAVYRRECADSILARLEQGIRKVTEAISDLQIERVDEIEWSLLDPEDCVLRNMNSPADYNAAKEWWERQNRKR